MAPPSSLLTHPPPSYFNLPFPSRRPSFCSPPPPPPLFPSPRTSPDPRAYASPSPLLCRCRHGKDGDDSAWGNDGPLARLGIGVMELLKSAGRVIGFGDGEWEEEEGEKKTEVVVEEEGEWDWERWKKHFVEIDEQELLISLLKSQLSHAVLSEEYEEAGRLKVAIAAASTSDTVGRAMFYLKRAIEEERYHDAALVRDDAGAGLVGWWAGTSQDTYDPYGIIVRITAEHGRYVARSYSPRQLATASSGVPLFELFLKVNKKGEYQQQAVYLKWREVSSQTSPFESSNALRSTSNLYPGDSTEEKSDIIITTVEEESDSNDREDTADFSEEIPSFQNILRDIVPGVKVKVIKVTAPGKVDRDLIAKVIEDMMDEEEQDNETDADNLEAEDEDKSESDREKEEIELDAGPDILENEGQNEFAVKVVMGGLIQKLSSNMPAKDLIRIPAKLEKRGLSSFSFSMVQKPSSLDSGRRKRFTSDKEEKLRNQRSIDQVVFDLTKLIGGEKIPVKVLKDVGELISLTLSQAHSHRSLSESTLFNRIDILDSLDPLSGLYIGAHGIYTSEVIHLKRKFGQWKEDKRKKDPKDVCFYEYVEAVKLTGDRYVPAGKVAFRAKIGKSYQLPHKGIIPEELGVIARYRGQGRLAEPGFRNPRWVDGELVILDGKYIRGGPVVGFVYWAPEYHFLVFFNRLRLQE
ncbi:hypothetical protein MLD38_026715 [Melastoma candidum]|uniref:Uncharacterized protein n=1 Tax=Melastoma candidum TaxID=119954 RepID=A0ACB9P2Y6_9MYRT|nr:hypothetical protein MLD38_026715 [Melastoma candidum]